MRMRSGARPNAPSRRAIPATRWSCPKGCAAAFYRSLVHVPTPAISDLRTTLSRRRRFIRIQTAEVNAVKRLLRGVGQNSGQRGSLRTDAHWQGLIAGNLVPEQFQEHVRHHYAVWRQAAEQA